MRTETMTPELAKQVARVRKSGFTFAPEAGSERMRRVINKTNRDEDLIEAVRSTVRAGWHRLKFYFMIGLPTETFDDVDAIVRLAKRARLEGRKISPGVNVTVSVSTFVPKPHTSFQWERQINVDETYEKHDRLREQLRKHKIKFRWHSPEQSYLEGVLSRGDRRLADALELAAKRGCRLDAWGEHHDGELWLSILEETLAVHGLTADDYLVERDVAGLLPWDHLDAGILKKFLMRDRKASYREATIQDCAFVEHCYACGGCDLGDPYNKAKDEDGKRLVQLRPEVFHAPPSVEADLELDVADPLSADPLEPSDLKPRRIRMRFAKLGRALHLSHLDIREHILRGIRLSDLPVAYSRGHNPRPKVGFTPACPTGIESEAEYFDMDYLGDLEARDCAERLSSKLPDGVFVLDFEEVPIDGPALNQVMESMTFVASLADDYPTAEHRTRVERFKGADQWPVRVLRKKRQRVLDAKAHIVDIAVVGLQLHLKLDFGGGLGALRIFEAVAAIVGIEHALRSRIRKQYCSFGPVNEEGEVIDPHFDDSVAICDLTRIFEGRNRRPKMKRKRVSKSANVPYAE